MKSKFAVLILASAILAACGNVPETKYFTIEWQKLSATTTTGKDILHIQPFDAAPMLKYDKMMYKTSMYEVKYDNFRRWAVAPGTLLSYKAAEYFQKTGLFDSVVLELPSGTQSYSLLGYVNHFEEIDYNNKHSVFVSVTFELTNFESRQPLLTTTIEKQVDVKAHSADAIVAAMSEAVKLVFDDLSTNIETIIK